MSTISVVIPAFNRADMIGETLASVFAQTLAPLEIIVVDDGSTDGTAELLARMSNRVRSIRIPNSGHQTARNVGLRAAQGELVAFCDDDDLWMPEFLETMAAQWDARPDLVSCYSNFRILRDGQMQATSKFDEARRYQWNELADAGPDGMVFETPIVDRLIAFQPLFPSAMVVRREAFLDAGGWDDSVNRHHISVDFATALRVANLPPLAVVSRPLVAIRKHAGNRSGDNQKMNTGEAHVLEHVLRTRPELAPHEKLIRDSIARRRHDALRLAFWRRDFKAVIELYSLLPVSFRGWKEVMKYAIATLPAPISAVAAALVSL